jgi:cytochrome c
VKIHHLYVFAGLALASTPTFAADTQSGQTIYQQRCASCHGTPSPSSTLAPSLAGIVGRKAASTKFNYSPALEASGLTWNRANLDRFLAAPMRMVPGTRMLISVPDRAQRSALLDYLASRR